MSKTWLSLSLKYLVDSQFFIIRKLDVNIYISDKSRQLLIKKKNVAFIHLLKYNQTMTD